MQSNGETSKKQQSKQVTKRQASLMETLTISQAGQEEIRRQAKAKKQEPLPHEPTEQHELPLAAPPGLGGRVKAEDWDATQVEV
jgi:hypothetical protein